ncbi:hypothetical protein GCM10020256_61310 [Streptomyces thermocoprophilus]
MWGDARVVVHFSTCGDDGRWAVELREPDGRGTTRARAGTCAGEEVRLPGGRRLSVEEPVSRGSGRLWWARLSGAGAGAAGPGGGVPGLLREHGRPVRYAYTERDQPLSVYQTVFAVPSPDGAGSAEMPSAGRPFTAGTVLELVRRGVQFAPVSLHTGGGVGGGARAAVRGAFRGAGGVGTGGETRRGPGAGVWWPWGRRRCGRWSRRPVRTGSYARVRGGPVWW